MRNNKTIAVNTCLKVLKIVHLISIMIKIIINQIIIRIKIKMRVFEMVVMRISKENLIVKIIIILILVILA